MGIKFKISTQTTKTQVNKARISKNGAMTSFTDIKVEAFGA